MDNLLSISPGLMIWTFINFGILLFLIIKFAGKPIISGLENRENHINEQIESAENANIKAAELLKESEDKIATAQEEMVTIVSKGREQVEIQLRKASEEADNIRRKKVDEATREIESQKIKALSEIRTEIAGIVVEATEKIIEEKIDQEKDLVLINKYIDKINQN